MRVNGGVNMKDEDKKIPRGKVDKLDENQIRQIKSIGIPWKENFLLNF